MVSAVVVAALTVVGCSSDDRSEVGSTTSTAGVPTSTTAPEARSDQSPELAPDLATSVRLTDPGLHLDEPIAASAVPTTAAMIVAERAGVLHEVRLSDAGAALVEPPLLDLRDRVGDASGERGLLGVAVDPEAASVVVSYTAADDGDSVIERYDLVLEPEGLAIDGASRVELLRVAQPYPNHNGGHVVFGPDSMLYVGLGDGGAGGDPHGNAQDPTSLLGKLLRLDPSAPNGVPADNPFVDEDGVRPEIWATGLRNPWRFSFDRANGDLWVADVGQNTWEEIDRLAASEGAGRGANLGWDLFEGRERFEEADPAPAPWSEGPFVEPVHVYGRDQGCSITGGVVYRGDALPGLRGAYLFADFCGQGIRAIDPGAPESSVELRGGALDQVVAFAEAPDGEVLVLSLSAGVRLLTGR